MIVLEHFHLDLVSWAFEKFSGNIRPAFYLQTWKILNYLILKQLQVLKTLRIEPVKTKTWPDISIVVENLYCLLSVLHGIIPFPLQFIANLQQKKVQLVVSRLGLKHMSSFNLDCL